MKGKKRIIAAGLVAAAGAIMLGARREAAGKTALLEQLRSNDTGALSAKVSFAELENLPAPVARYFRYALADGQPMIHSACYRQAGKLRTDIHSTRWFYFDATQHAAPASHGFLWDASVHLLPFIYLNVRDGYVLGRGSGKMSLFSAIPFGEETGGTEMNSGALHRYLAEAVWYPTALLPASGVQWSAIDDRRALATLTDSGIKVSLEFIFGDAGQVTGIYTPGRWGKFNTGFRKVAWEGHFATYEERHGMRIPLQGEVGWYEADQWHPVWEGQLLDVAYEWR